MDVTGEFGSVCSSMQSFPLLKNTDRHPRTNDMQTYGVKTITTFCIWKRKEKKNNYYKIDDNNN